jgi:hypothetical protein
MIAVFPFLVGKAVAQEEVTKSIKANLFLNRYSVMRGNLISGNALQAIPEENTGVEIEGDPFWNNGWLLSSIQLYDDDKLYDGYWLRYDLYNDVFQVKVDDFVMALPGVKVYSVIGGTEEARDENLFINAKEFSLKGVNQKGLFEVLEADSVMLLRKTQVEILKPDYNAALNVGHKSARIVKKDLFFYNNGSELVRIKSEKDLYSLYGNSKATMQHFTQAENIDFKVAEDLQKLFRYFFSLKN